MTHQELVQRAAAWLRGTMKCKPVLCELNCWSTSEAPDVFGVNSKGSIVVECKTSVSDFYADLRKPFRARPEDGMGRLRFYFTPKGLIAPDRLTLAHGWGLVEMHGRACRVVKDSEVFRQASNEECILMRSAWLWRRDMQELKEARNDAD